jgi:hypothetical protein
VTRGRLVGTGLPAPFERDPRNPLDRRARGARADVTAVDDAAGADRDTQGDTDIDDLPIDEG